MDLRLIVLIFLIKLTKGDGDRAKDQMYELFNGQGSCFRRMNGTHQTGCSSERGGSIGILHYVESQGDLDFILKVGSAGNYMPIIPNTLLTPKTVTDVIKSKKVSGLVIYKEQDKMTDTYSHELSCPNEASNVQGTCNNKWNKVGSGILHWDIPFPIYYVDSDDDLTKMKECFQKFNNFSYDLQYTRSLCNIEIDTFMFATKDSKTCIRRSNSKTNLNPIKFCDTLGGENIWASLYPLSKTSPKNYIIVSGRLDTTSMFNNYYPGAINPANGLVKFLATADLVKRMIGKFSSPKMNILFILFNGETYDYIGSQRFVYDMENDAFPVKIDSDIKNPLPLIHLSDISLYIELGELTITDGIYVHSNRRDSNQIQKFNSILESNKGDLIVNANWNDGDVPLPPGSIQSFLKSNSTFSGLILTDYKTEYANKFYNSIYDNSENLNFTYYNSTEDKIPNDSIQVHTANFSQMLAKTLYEEVTGEVYHGSEKPNLELINELYNCYLLDSHCKVHQAVQRKRLKEVQHTSYSFYVGVSVVSNLLTYAVGLTLGWLTGDVVDSTKPCKNDPDEQAYNYFNMSKSLEDLNTTICYRTTVNFTEASSPAFIIPDYDWKSGQYSSWTESTWNDLSVRMFVRPSAAHERFTLAIGSITLIMSLILAYFVKSRSHILFVIPENCSPTSC